MLEIFYLYKIKCNQKKSIEKCISSTQKPVNFLSTKIKKASL